jgi:hypothetical protein
MAFLLSGLLSTSKNRRFYVVVKQEGPMFFLCLLPPLLPKFHGASAIRIVLGYKTTFHLLQLRSHIAAKE